MLVIFCGSPRCCRDGGGHLVFQKQRVFCGWVCSGNEVSSSQDPPLQNTENTYASAALCPLQNKRLEDRPVDKRTRHRRFTVTVYMNWQRINSSIIDLHNSILNLFIIQCCIVHQAKIANQFKFKAIIILFATRISHNILTLTGNNWQFILNIMFNLE